MPKAEIESATQTPYKEPHEREKGPWSDWEIEDASRHLEHAEKIKGNPKLMEAVAKHHEKKAKHHREMSASLKHHMKAGRVSEKQMEKAKGRY